MDGAEEQDGAETTVRKVAEPGAPVGAQLTAPSQSKPAAGVEAQLTAPAGAQTTRAGAPSGLPVTNNVFDTALVLEGGGYCDAFTAGVVSSLLEAGIYFDYVCGLSAGASNSVNYVSRDQQRIRDSFILNEKTRGAVGLRPLLRHKGYFDADFLYEEAPHNGALPFDWEAFSANPARVKIQAFERDTGKTVRFDRSDMTDLDRMMDLVRASSTLPGAMHPLPVDGRTFYDGGLGKGAGIPLTIAEDDGFERFFFVATSERGYRMTEPAPHVKRLYQHFTKDYPYLRKALLSRWERYNAAMEHLEELEAQGRALVVWPDHMDLRCETADPKKQEAAYELGRAQAARDLPRWREFLGV